MTEDDIDFPPDAAERIHVKPTLPRAAKTRDARGTLETWLCALEEAGFTVERDSAGWLRVTIRREPDRARNLFDDAASRSESAHDAFF